jgi:hypothetical protein
MFLRMTPNSEAGQNFIVTIPVVANGATTILITNKETLMTNKKLEDETRKKKQFSLRAVAARCVGRVVTQCCAFIMSILPLSRFVLTQEVLLTGDGRYLKMN